MPSGPVTAALLLVALLAARAPADAQLSAAGTGSVLGVVSDETGAVLPNVQVTVSGDALGPSRTTTSRAGGEYHFVQLPPGDYVLTYRSPGFEHQARAAHVGLGTTLTIDVTLSVAPVHEEVAVAGLLDRYSAAVSQSFTVGQLSSLPASRSVGGLFAHTHAVMLSAPEVGGGTGIITGGYGAYGRNNSPRHTLEGIVVTGLFGAGFSPDYGALEEVSVLTAAPGAEWATSGIHTDIVTRSGTNQYRGTVYGAAEHRRWQSSNVDADQIRRGALGGGGLLPGQVNQLWGNADVNADTGGFIRRDRLWWYASGRHQEVSARLVNFEAEPYVTRLTNYSGKVTARLSPGHTLVFYGQRGNNQQPYRLDPFGPAGSGLSATSAINTTAASTADQRNGNWLWKVGWNAIVSDAVVFEVRAGQWAVNSDWRAYSVAPRFEDVDTLEVRGGNRDWTSRHRRNQVAGSASYILGHRTGDHFLRVGGEGLRFLVQETWVSGYPGDVLHVLRNAQPSSVFLFETPASSEGGVWTWSAWASDGWQVNRRLTLTLGVRLDRYRVFLPEQSHGTGPDTQRFAAVPNLIDWNLVTPRLAAVVDLTGDGRTLAKATFGRYRGAPNAALAFNSSPNSSPWWKQYSWSDPNQSGQWEPGEEGDFQRSRGGRSLESIDPDLNLPLIDEAGAWIERMLGGGVTLRAGTVWRLERFLFARQNLNQPFDRFTAPVLVLDRGPDGLAGTADDGPTYTAYDLDPAFRDQPAVNEVRNVPGATNEYLTWEVAATRQTRGRWSLGAGFAYTWNSDHSSSYAGQTVRNNTLPLTPNDLINTREGGRHTFTTWTAKAHGTFDAPWRFRVTPVWRHQSGQPFGRTQTTDRGQLRYATVTMLMEPVGRRRLDHITLLDLRIDRAIPVRGGRVTAFLDVFNLLNANPEQNAIWSSGPSFLRPVTIVAPRIARVGLTFDW